MREVGDRIELRARGAAGTQDGAGEEAAAEEDEEAARGEDGSLREEDRMGAGSARTAASGPRDAHGPVREGGRERRRAEAAVVGRERMVVVRASLGVHYGHAHGEPPARRGRRQGPCGGHLGGEALGLRPQVGASERAPARQFGGEEAVDGERQYAERHQQDEKIDEEILVHGGIF